MPLISHIGIRGMHERLSFEEVNGRWDSAEFIGMGSNIQFVFYRNNKGDILVKILYNEKETDGRISETIWCKVFHRFLRSHQSLYQRLCR